MASHHSLHSSILLSPQQFVGTYDFHCLKNIFTTIGKVSRFAWFVVEVLIILSFFQEFSKCISRWKAYCLGFIYNKQGKDLTCFGIGCLSNLSRMITLHELKILLPQHFLLFLQVHAIPLRSSWVMTCAYAPSGNYVACGKLIHHNSD